MRHDIWIGLRKVSRQLDQVVKYKSGELVDATTIALFQSPIQSDLERSLPGNYGLRPPVQRSLHEQAVMG
jgi:hypothetical protein